MNLLRKARAAALFAILLPGNTALLRAQTVADPRLNLSVEPKPLATTPDMVRILQVMQIVSDHAESFRIGLATPSIPEQRTAFIAEKLLNKSSANRDQITDYVNKAAALADMVAAALMKGGMALSPDQLAKIQEEAEALGPAAKAAGNPSSEGLDPYINDEAKEFMRYGLRKGVINTLNMTIARAQAANPDATEGNRAIWAENARIEHDNAFTVTLDMLLHGKPVTSERYLMLHDAETGPINDGIRDMEWLLTARLRQANLGFEKVDADLDRLHSAAATAEDHDINAEKAALSINFVNPVPSVLAKRGNGVPEVQPVNLPGFRNQNLRPADTNLGSPEFK